MNEKPLRVAATRSLLQSATNPERLRLRASHFSVGDVTECRFVIPRRDPRRGAQETLAWHAVREGARPVEAIIYQRSRQPGFNPRVQHARPARGGSCGARTRSQVGCRRRRGGKWARRPNLTCKSTLHLQNLSWLTLLEPSRLQGAGALAGPLVCAAVALRGGTADLSLDELGDSKKLSAKKRARLHAQLNADASVVIATAVLSAGEVDRLNILEARRTGLAQAVDALPDAPDFLFVDGIFTLPDAPVPLNQQEAVIQGDASISVVAAASIVAKEVRDTIMAGKLHEKFPQFEFDRHKGYGTARHRALLHEFGPCSEHRFSFRPVREAAAVHCVQVAPSSPLC